MFVSSYSYCAVLLLYQCLLIGHLYGYCCCRVKLTQTAQIYVTVVIGSVDVNNTLEVVVVVVVVVL